MGRTQGILSRFPHFYLAEEGNSLFSEFIKVFGETLDEVEADLLKMMYAHYVNKADNEGSQGFNTNQKGDLDKIFSLYLENLGGTSQLKQVDRPSGAEGIESDKIYRQRIRGLIEVLKSGASTKQGIINIVAANLGVVGEDEKAIAARHQIRILEFLPKFQTLHWNDLLPLGEFDVENPNVVETYPEVRLFIKSKLPFPLTHPRIINLTTEQFAQYDGMVKNGDLLSFFADKTASLNGIPIEVKGGTPILWPGASRWRFEAMVGEAKAAFDQTLFDFSLFGTAAESLKPPSPEQAAQFAIDITMTIAKITPGSFMVQIPWDIPGFSENLDKFADRPREQIKYIVDKVKAAGVFAVIAYEKTLGEDHELG